MSSAKREQPTVLRWDDVVELVRRGNVAPPRRVTFPFPQKGRPAGAHADVGAGQSANLVSHTSAAKLLGDLVSGVSAIAAPVQEWAAMIPEAFHSSPQFNGLLLVVGFVALLILLVLSH